MLSEASPAQLASHSLIESSESKAQSDTEMERMTAVPWAAGMSGQGRLLGSEFLFGKMITPRDGGR